MKSAIKHSEAINSFNAVEREFEQTILAFKNDKEITNALKKNRCEFKKAYFELITKTLDENAKYFMLKDI